MNGAGNQYASRRRFCFQSRGYVHSIAVEIVSLDDHIAEMQTDTKDNPLCFGTFRVHFVHGLLELNRRRQRVDCAGKFYERPITRQLDQPAAVSGERWFEAPSSMLAQSRQRSALVAPHEAGVADNIGSENCHQFALVMDHGNFPRSLPDPRRLAPARQSSGRAGRAATVAGGRAMRGLPKPVDNAPPRTVSTPRRRIGLDRQLLGGPGPWYGPIPPAVAGYRRAVIGLARPIPSVRSIYPIASRGSRWDNIGISVKCALIASPAKAGRPGRGSTCEPKRLGRVWRRSCETTSRR